MMKWEEFGTPGKLGHGFMATDLELIWLWIELDGDGTNSRYHARIDGKRSVHTDHSYAFNEVEQAKTDLIEFAQKEIAIMAAGVA
jgi:hypothetical protein